MYLLNKHLHCVQIVTPVCRNETMRVSRIKLNSLRPFAIWFQRQACAAAYRAARKRVETGLGMLNRALIQCSSSSESSRSSSRRYMRVSLVTCRVARATGKVGRLGWDKRSSVH